MALTVLAILAASAASATTLGWTKVIAGNQTTYNYTLTSSEYGDFVTAVHIFAPLDPALILGHTGPANWDFDAFIDPDPEFGTDIYWYTDEAHGIANGGRTSFSLSVPSWTSTKNDYIPPGYGYSGNWGYETANWSGSVLVSFPSVPVPQGAQAASTPEPTSLLALCVGCCGFLVRIRRKY